MQEVEFLYGTKSACHECRRLTPRGWLDGRRSGKARVGGLTQLHGQGSSEHPSGIEKYPPMRFPSPSLPVMEKDSDAAQPKRKSAREYGTYLG